MDTHTGEIIWEKVLAGGLYINNMKYEFHVTFIKMSIEYIYVL